MVQPCGCPEELSCGCLIIGGAATTVTGNGSVGSPYVINSTAYQEIQDEGVALPPQDTLNFIGMAVTVTDDPGNSRTNVTIATPEVSFVRKTASESVLNSTALQNDDQLVLPVVANATYKVALFVNSDGSTTGDSKFAWTAPAGATMVWGEAFTGNGFETPGGVAVRQQLGAGTFQTIHIDGTLVTAGTAGNLQLQWAQNALDAVVPTRVRAGSFLKLERFA